MSRTRARAIVAVLASWPACDEQGAIDEDRDARAFLDEVRADDYVQWMDMAIEGRAPHGSWSAIFLDAQMQAALAGPTREAWPDGVTLVCEGRAKADGATELLMVMRKREGTWWWAQYDADDEPLVFGTAVGCVHCHAAGQDFTRTFKLP